MHDLTRYRLPVLLVLDVSTPLRPVLLRTVLMRPAKPAISLGTLDSLFTGNKAFIIGGSVAGALLACLP